jgi:hypothetical protein
VTVRRRRKPIELLFNLEHPDELALVTEVDEDNDQDGDDDLELELDEADSSEDELQKRFDKMAFVVATRKLEQLPHWVKVTDVFQSDSDAPFLKRAGITDFEDPRYQKYSERLARLRGVRKYSYRMDVLERSMGYDEVTEIFVRVNSLGAKLRSSDLALAQITARWRGALEIFQEFQKQCEAIGYELDLGLHLRNLVALATGQSRFLTVGNVTLDKLQSSWKDAVKGMEYAINFMRSNARIESPTLLSSPFILVALSNYAHRRSHEVSPDEADRIRYWVLLANAKGRYSRGSSETILDQDLAVLRQGGADELIERLRQQVGRLDIAPEELEGRNQRSALFKTMFLAFHAAGAKDWRSNLAIALDHSGNQHRLQFHHIFPKALLKRTGFSAREADDIANLAFIGGKTNRSISDKSPAEYLPALMQTAGEDVFTKQCIPTNPALLAPESYKKFLTERRKLISQRLNEYLQVVP